MKIIEKINAKQKDPEYGQIPSIVFLGDSVTQGCFDVYCTSKDSLETVFDIKHAYHTYLTQIINMLYPNVPLSITNAGISGTNSALGYERLEKDVLRFSPDLVVVSFGLNDCTQGEKGLENYKNNLRNIFTDIQKTGSEVIFMTSNMMNTYTKYTVKEEFLRVIADSIAEHQNGGNLEMYFEAGKKVAEECGVKVCDVYAKWKTMYENGVDITMLLSNDINHPTREMNKLFAYSLIETMMSK